MGLSYYIVFAVVRENLLGSRIPDTTYGFYVNLFFQMLLTSLLLWIVNKIQYVLSADNNIYFFHAKNVIRILSIFFIFEFLTCFKGFKNEQFFEFFVYVFVFYILHALTKCSLAVLLLGWCVNIFWYRKFLSGYLEEMIDIYTYRHKKIFLFEEMDYTIGLLFSFYIYIYLCVLF